MFANSWPSVSNFKSFSQSLEQFWKQNTISFACSIPYHLPPTLVFTIHVGSKYRKVASSRLSVSSTFKDFQIVYEGEI